MIARASDSCRPRFLGFAHGHRLVDLSLIANGLFGFPGKRFHSFWKLMLSKIEERVSKCLNAVRLEIESVSSQELKTGRSDDITTKSVTIFSVNFLSKICLLTYKVLQIILKCGFDTTHLEFTSWELCEVPLLVSDNHFQFFLKDFSIFYSYILVNELEFSLKLQVNGLGGLVTTPCIN